MGMKETPIRSSFLGLVKSADCPGCGASLSKSLGAAKVLCTKCGDYFQFGDKTLRPFDPACIASAPAFAAPTPWPDMVAVTFGAVTHPLAELTDMIMTRREGVRLLDAKWPAGCCVCGRPAAREETISQHVEFFAPNGLKPRRQAAATVVAKGVPHCAEHAGGVRFERESSAGGSTLGLFFRSHAYSVQFRKLNPWKWPA